MSVRIAVWVGVLLVNGPVIPLMVGPLCIGQWLLSAGPVATPVLLILRFALAWSWWSVP
jgi:hypothetical protein